MLRKRTREEDNAVLIDMASLEPGTGSSYGSTAHAAEVPSTLGVAVGMVKAPFSLLPRLLRLPRAV